MAHNLDFSKNGQASFIAYQQAAWHGLGEIFTEKISASDAMERAGLDFTVLKLPNIHILPNSTEVISDSSFFTCRTDTNVILGDKLGKDYSVMQNVEALNIVDEILQSGRATIETAGVLHEGRKAFICLKIDKSIFVGTDEVCQYVLIATSHDGSMSITALGTNVRVVCHNTLSAALNSAKGAIKIRHTANAASRLHEAAKVLKLIADNTAINTDNYNKMKETVISKADLMNYFGNVFFDEKEIKQLQAGNSMKEAVSTRKQNTMIDVANFAARGVGQAEALGTNGLNMWYAYNAVTGLITSRKYASANDRANNMLFGTGATIIKDAGELALCPAKIQPLHKVINSNGLNYN